MLRDDLARLVLFGILAASRRRSILRQPENNRRLKINPSRFQAALDRVRSKAAHPTVGFRLPLVGGQPESLYCGMIWRGLFCLAFWRRAVAVPFEAV